MQNWPTTWRAWTLLGFLIFPGERIKMMMRRILLFPPPTKNMIIFGHLFPLLVFLLSSCTSNGERGEKTSPQTNSVSSHIILMDVFLKGFIFDGWHFFPTAECENLTIRRTEDKIRFQVLESNISVQEYIHEHTCECSRNDPCQPYLNEPSDTFFQSLFPSLFLN